jgi:hypothetical protein
VGARDRNSFNASLVYPLNSGSLIQVIIYVIRLLVIK